MMGIVHGDSIHQATARQDAVPDLLETRNRTPAGVVHLGMPVEDLEEPRALQLPEVVSRNRPPEVGVVHVRNPVRSTDALDAPPQHVRHARACWREDEVFHGEAVDVHRFARGARGDLLPLDDDELVAGAVHRVQTGDLGQVVVVGEHEKVIAMLPVPADHLVRRAVAVAVHRVRMGVSLEPPEVRHRGGLGPAVAQRDDRRQNQQGQHPCRKDEAHRSGLHARKHTLCSPGAAHTPVPRPRAT